MILIAYLRKYAAYLGCWVFVVLFHLASREYYYISVYVCKMLHAFDQKLIFFLLEFVFGYKKIQHDLPNKLFNNIISAPDSVRTDVNYGSVFPKYGYSSN